MQIDKCKLQSAAAWLAHTVCCEGAFAESAYPDAVRSPRCFLAIRNLQFAIIISQFLSVTLSLSAAPSAPSSLTPKAAVGPGRVYLDWPAVAGATSYNVKRSTVPGGPHTLLNNVTTSYYSDTTPTTGVVYYYAVTTVSNGVESASFRETAASPGIVVDNLDIARVTSTGSWPVSGLSGCYSNDSVYAAATAGASPTATFRFTPSLPFFGNFDIYMRWPAYSNRATNTPVDVRYADGGLTTVTVDQTTGGSTWVFLGTFPCVSGTSCSVEIRNNTGALGSYVAADAVQFVPRLGPWGPRDTKLEDYTITTFSDECSAFDTEKWSTALGRTNVSVSNGKISLDIDWIGDTPIGDATAEEFQSPYNWLKGAVQPVHDKKYGYYETRFRVVQAGGGVDCAFWQNSTGSLLPYEDFEFDSPEVFPDATLTDTELIYGMWDHRGGSPPWRMNAIHKDHDWAVGYHTYGMEWRTDNSLVHYLDGEQIFTAPASAINLHAFMSPVAVYLSTYVGNYWLPTTAINGQSMKVDYLRCYQKPGWTGALNGNWGTANNWGPDGVPGTGEAAVFNKTTTNPAITLAADKQVQSLHFEGDVAPLAISGPGQLQLGAGDADVTQGGISIGSTVTNSQRINANIVGLQDLTFINNSATDAALILNGPINGSGAAREIHFAANAPIVVTQPLGNLIGDVIKWGPAEFALPANSAHTGRTLLAQGTMLFDHAANGGEPSGLGAASANATNLLLYPRAKHSVESLRPRLRYTGPAATTNRGLTLGYFCDGVLEASGTGPITWIGAFALEPGNTGTAILEFGGTNPDTNTFAAAVNDTGSGVTLKVRKTGPGKWVLTGTNVWTGTTEVNAGTLVISGRLTTPGNLSVDGTLAGRGAITCGNATFGSAARLQWEPGNNALAAATVTVTGGAAIDLVLSTVNVNDTYWGIARTWPVVTATAMTGTFNLGTIGPDAAGRAASTYGAFSFQQTATGVTLAWTPDPNTFASWQNLNWPGETDPNIIGPTADPDRDGLANLLEHALRLSPTAASTTGITLARSGESLLFTYQRPASRPGLTYAVEVAPDLTRGSWTNSGVTHTRIATGDPETWQASYDTAGLLQLFSRLKVTLP